MKILLLEHPRTVSPERCNDIANTPLSSCLLTGYAAGILKHDGHEVEIIEGHLDGLSYQDVMQRVRAAAPDLLGVHMVYHWQDDQALFDFLEQVKGEGLSAHITAYGFYPSFAFENILQGCPALDSIIIGEPELTIAELAKNLSSQIDPSGISGLACRDESGKVHFQRCNPIEDLDLLPFPLRTDAMYRLPEVNLAGSRGCYGACTFCYINPFYSPKSQWRCRSVENIVAEIDEIISERGTRDFYFIDPNFFGPGQKGQRRALHLASLLKARNIRFGIEARVNDIHDQTIAALKEAGLRQILIGLESGRDQSLKRLNKMTTVAQNEQAIKILRKHGIEPNIGFIMFEPDASLEDVRANFEFLQRNDLLKNLSITANLLYHNQIILMGTPAYQKLQGEGRLEIQTSANYEGATSFINPKVAILASIMRQITNHLFIRMAGIWGGKVQPTSGARERYDKMNGLLIEWFSNVLDALQAGECFTEKQKNSFVDEAQKEINALIPSKTQDQA